MKMEREPTIMDEWKQNLVWLFKSCIVEVSVTLYLMVIKSEKKDI